MTSHQAPRWIRSAMSLLLVLSLAGCSLAMVDVKSIPPGEYIAIKRGDILTTGELSAATREMLRVAGLDDRACARPQHDCLQALTDVHDVNDERRMAALTELWMQRALSLAPKGDAAPSDAQLDAWFEVARHAYAYLFFSARTPGERAFEDRQTQVRDYYNLATQEAATALFARYAGAPGAEGEALQQAGWTIRTTLEGVRLPDGVDLPEELIPASSLQFAGLRSVYRRDGFGAELVAVMQPDPVTTIVVPDAEDATDTPHRRQRPQRRDYSEMPSPALTVLLRFPADDLAQLMATREVALSVHDPYVDSVAQMHGQQVPLAANFTAGYGLWLARSGFATQSLRTLFGRDHGIDRPHLYMMQPYDPDRRILLMLHGLASSPEAWVNVANEVLGDETLRQNFQIWQIYYPTNMPIALNHAQIRRTVDDALTHFDPDRRARASQNMVVVGHSMGGVIARLMVSSSGDALWDAVTANREIAPGDLRRVQRRLSPFLRFEPMPQIERAVFIAAPHRGTDIAGTRAGRWISRLVRLPLTFLENFDDVLQTLGGSAQTPDGSTGRIPNSIDNLSASDPFVRAAADLPRAPGVTLHTIIAQRDPAVPLAQSNDGLVPYASAHLDDAVSEKVIVSGHSVQETAPAILELRRILHEDVAAHPLD
ncbi:alpha/beta fold hydrolase [Luteimonas fraxinea]|uniref:Alpha/beta fold hydrolase n=1 Tax=Luteimonas fraxinea TaxID=2901869 RepID=A0ABS8UFQ5_9GAMM|nr:alpha/beta fold hydrolase [Luteimonas fraxinea]MCD9097715.1 alpha/beta fold hydrolase [Luteimonas fraxinea]MCD9127573.1 alpha/beta fold hydrolase [Luteimonas fraxinea]UHH08611.1 alpha/beta fold hydrolase [Luteimonas fraxinea]